MYFAQSELSRLSKTIRIFVVVSILDTVGAVDDGVVFIGEVGHSTTLSFLSLSFATLSLAHAFSSGGESKENHKLMT